MTFDSCFLFLDNPNGGVEDIGYLKQKCPWVKGLFLNIKDYLPSQWEAVVIPRCEQYGISYGPWGRTTKGDQNNPDFDPTVVDKIVEYTDKWQDIGIVNSESELNKNPNAINYIPQAIGNRNMALSMVSNPYDSVDWTVVADIPTLVQIFPIEAPGYEPIATRNKWWSRGVKCIYMTYGTYGGMKPSDFPLVANYSLFTGDVIMATHTVERWIPTSTGWVACKPSQEVDVAGVADSAKKAFSNILTSTTADAWRRDNPGEVKKVSDYNVAPPGTVPPVLASSFGKGLIELIEARKYGDGSY